MVDRLVEVGIGEGLQSDFRAGTEMELNPCPACMHVLGLGWFGLGLLGCSHLVGGWMLAGLYRQQLHWLFG